MEAGVCESGSSQTNWILWKTYSDKVRLKYEKGLKEQNIKLEEKQKKSDARVEQYAKNLASGKKAKTTKEEKAKAEEVANNAKI